MKTEYDAIVIGARCGGSPTAMLLAQQGHRVLLVDKASFPSDTMSTHMVHPPGIAALARWGLLEQLQATGCPPINDYIFDFGDVRVAGHPAPIEGIATAYSPRRIVLDAILVEAAAAAGAEVREEFVVDEFLFEDGQVTGIRGRRKNGPMVTEKARVVVGADGRNSMVAKAVGAERYHEVEDLCVLYYAYWSGLPVDGFETYDRPEHSRGWATFPTHDGLTCLIQGWPQVEFDANRKDIEGSYLRSFEHVPEFAERVRAATRETRFAGTRNVAGFFRKPYGPGWALVGDAGYHLHPITGFGMTDAFLCAEELASALGDYFAGRRAYDDGLADYQRSRDERSLPMYELTNELATLEPPPPEIEELIGAMRGNQDAMNGFVSMTAGTLPVPEFLGPEHAGRIVAEAAASPV